MHFVTCCDLFLRLSQFWVLRPLGRRRWILSCSSRRSCGTCKVFKREVLPIYAASPAGKVFPLWVVEMGGKAPFRLNEPVTFTPTFVWVDNGVEVGRFSGYFGKEKFFSIVNKAANAHMNGGRHKTSAVN